MGTCFGRFRVLILDSLKYSSMVESTINRSTRAVILRNLTTSWHNHLFIYLFFVAFYLLYTENKHFRLICIVIATDITAWPELLKRKYLYNLRGQSNSSVLLLQTLLKSHWYLLNICSIVLFIFSNVNFLPAYMCNKRFNFCGERTKVVNCSSNF